MGCDDGPTGARAGRAEASSGARGLTRVAALCACAACGGGSAAVDASTADASRTGADAVADQSLADAADGGAEADAAGGSTRRNDRRRLGGMSSRFRLRRRHGLRRVFLRRDGAVHASAAQMRIPGPCGGALACGCADSLCAGYASCDVDRDAGAVFCLTISMDNAGPL